VVAMLVPALRDLSRAYELWNAYVVARERIRLFLGRRPSVKVRASGPALPEGPGEVRFDDVVLGDLFNGLTATARSGSRVAIVGANGSGKSTLLSLIARLMEPDSGRILIDGHDLRTVNAASLREAIGVASADLPLMRGTVGRNIRYRRPRASDAEVRRVCELCGIDEMLADIPGGMAARVAEGGLNLSPGQRQRIAIARALLGNPRILLLDEIDANLDGEASRLFERVLEASKGTILFVSHRKEQITKADVVWRLVEGSIIEQGSPAALSGRVGSSGLPLERRATRAA
jgi:ATP-binding cassette subfamily B protein